jgi:hypothetical protein
MEGDSMSGDALHNISITYAEFSDSYSAEEIDECFVTNDKLETNLVSNQGWCKPFFCVFYFYAWNFFSFKKLHIMT